MATYITKSCGKCGYSNTVSSYGYMNDPIGIRVSRCPACNTLSKEEKSKEWIQMNAYQKFRAINPRGQLRVACLTFLTGMALLVPLAKLPFVVVLIIAFPLQFLILNYLFTVLKLNGKSFRKRYCNSILRSRNESYRKLLEEEGRIYGESIPSWLLCSKKTRKAMDDYIATHGSVTTNFQIPTFMDTIKNDI